MKIFSISLILDLLKSTASINVAANLIFRMVDISGALFLEKSTNAASNLFIALVQFVLATWYFDLYFLKSSIVAAILFNGIATKNFQTLIRISFVLSNKWFGKSIKIFLTISLKIY